MSALGLLAQGLSEAETPAPVPWLALLLKVLVVIAALGVAGVALAGIASAAGALRQPYCTFLSLRYLRARKTNWIGVAGIFVAVTALILILSIMAGFLSESKRHLRGNLADVIIAPRQDVEPLPPGEVAPMLAALKADPRVVAACTQLNGIGIFTPLGRGEVLANPVYSDICLVNLAGVDVADENATTDFRSSLTAPSPYGTPLVADPDDPFHVDERWFEDGPPLPGVVIGAQLAYSLALDVGDLAEVVTITPDPETGRLGEPTNRTVVVAGTFLTGENQMDMERVYFDRRTLAEDILGRKVPWTHVLVKLADYERDKQAFVADVRAKLADMGYLHQGRTALEKQRLRKEVETWEDFRSSILGAIENEKSLMGVMLSLVMLVAGFTVFALLSMMVSEKRRDIGILTALGATPWRVMGLFVLIGCWEALIGATLGAGAGIWAARNIDGIERGLSSLLGVQIFDRSVYYFSHIPSVVEATGVAAIVLFGVLSVLVFSAFPAWRAARLDPVDALRFE